MTELSRSQLFNYRKLTVFSVGFAAAVFVLHKLALYVCYNRAAFDCPTSWPISIFHGIRPNLPRTLTAAGVLILFLVLWFFLEKTEYRLGHVILAGILLVVASNLIQGWQIGLYAPISGSSYTGTLVPIAHDGQEYYHDVIRIEDPRPLLFNYNDEQLKLNQHSYTHPPGAVLLFFVLLKIFRHPGLVSLFIAIVSVSFSAFFLFQLLSTELRPDHARYCTFLFLLLPAVQIYYLATLDALITTVMLGIVYCFRRSDQIGYLLAASGLIVISFMLTFVSLFIIPVLVLFELWERRSLRRSLVVLTFLVTFHLVLYFVFGYNAWRSFRTTSQFENPHGFMLFVDPVNYIFTRLEDVFELLVFLGPWLLLLIARGWKIGWKTRSKLNALSLLGILTLLAMFASGAFRTGETARAANFIFPYLLIPIALVSDRTMPNRRSRIQLSLLVFGQAILMQLIGNYFY